MAIMGDSGIQDGNRRADGIRTSSTDFGWIRARSSAARRQFAEKFATIRGLFSGGGPRPARDRAIRNLLAIEGWHTSCTSSCEGA
jgi:hypothetical protein